MNTVKAFLKKYWITCCIFIGLVALYIFLTSNGLVNPYLFPYSKLLILSEIVYNV